MSTSTAEVESIRGLTLDTLRDGAAIKLFDEQLQAVAANMKATAKLAPIQTGELQHRLKKRGDRHQIVLGL